MILVDFSAIFHQMVHSSVKICNPAMDGEKYKTEEFMPFCYYRIFESLFDLHTRFSNQYGNIVICLDKTNKHNWRKDIYSDYKGNRKESRDISLINFSEVFKYLDILLNELKTNSPYKVVESEGAEADDVILCLAKHYSKFEKIMIISSDKDMIQAQKHGNVKQFSLLTQKFITYETKNADSIDEWLIEHVVLGDTSDNVPKIVDTLEFSDNFKSYLNNKNLKITPFEFEKNHDLYNIKDYNIFKTNKKGENTALDIFKKPRFGLSNIKKNIETFGTLENWINSDEHLKYNYERNKKLVLEEFIPQDIFVDCVNNYENAPTNYDYNKFKIFLNDNKISNLETILPSNFVKSDVPIENFFDF